LKILKNVEKILKKQHSNAWRSSRSNCPFDHACCLQLTLTNCI